jgi:hypothetical protein
VVNTPVDELENNDFFELFPILCFLAGTNKETLFVLVVLGWLCVVVVDCMGKLIKLKPSTEMRMSSENLGAVELMRCDSLFSTFSCGFQVAYIEEVVFV